MKRKVWLPMLLGTFLLAGCGVQLDTGEVDSEVEEFAVRAEVFESEIDSVKNTVERLADEQQLSVKDQERLAQEIAYAKQAMKQFQESDEVLIGKVIKEVSEEKLKEVEEVLSEVEQNAEEGHASKEDLQKVEEALEPDLVFSLFEK